MINYHAMAQMDEEIRKGILRIFNRIIDDPKSAEKAAREKLIQVGIEPSLEIILAYVIGFIIGAAAFDSTSKYDNTRDEDIKGAMKILEDRAWILREAFARSRAV